MLYKEIQAAVDAAMIRADEYYGEKLPRPKVRFDLKGRTAGTAHYPKGLRFNVPLAKDNADDFLKQTVPHEVAHWVQGWKYGHGNTKPHGREWKAIMMQVYHLRPDRCHRYDTSKTQTRKQRRYTYRCKCKTWELTTTRHNKAKKGAVYSCPKCRFQLTLAPQPKKELYSEDL